MKTVAYAAVFYFSFIKSLLESTAEILYTRIGHSMLSMMEGKNVRF